jgi:hypothetical protein
MSNAPIREKFFYSEGDEYEIVSLLKLCFPEWKRLKDPVSYWKWKWVNSPNGYTIIYIRQNNKIVSITHIIYFGIKVGDSILQTSYSDDLATHPDYRGQGLYKELRSLVDNEESKKGSKIIYSVNTNPITIKINLRRGRSVLPYKIKHVVFIKNAFMHFKKINVKYNVLYSIGFNFLKLFNSFSNMFKNIKNNNMQLYQVRQINNFDHKYDVFWNSIKKDYKFIGEKKTDFLNWRYSDKGGNYQIYEVSEENKILGFMVLEIRDDNGYKIGYILELLSLKNRDDVMMHLVNHLEKERFKYDINVIYYKTTNRDMIKLLNQFGFIKMPFTKEFQAMYKFIDSDREKQIFLMAKSNEIYWSTGDYFP